MKKIKIHLDKEVRLKLDSEPTGNLSKPTPVEPANFNYLLSSDSPDALEKKHEDMLSAKLESLREFQENQKDDSDFAKSICESNVDTKMLLHQPVEMKDKATFDKYLVDKDNK